MSESMITIHWRRLTQNQRDALVAQHIFGREVVQWHPERDMLMRRVGVEGHESIPKYTTSMDEAWKVLQCVMEKYYTHNRISDEFEIFADALSPDHEVVYDELCPGMELFKIVAKWTPETIAIAALKAYDVAVDMD